MIKSAELQFAKFRWKPSTRVRGGSAQKCGERYYELSRALKRAPNRQDVLMDATENRDSPFRAVLFRENDTAAARRWRLELAGEIIRSIEVVTVRKAKAEERTAGIETVTVGMPVAYHVGVRGYQMATDVLGDEELRQQALANITQGLEAWRKKLQDFEELADDFDQLIVKARKLLKKEVPAVKT